MSDPLPQALILTAIVITFGVASFVLALIYRSWRLVRQEVVGIDEEDRRVARREGRSEEHTSELQSRQYLVCRLLLEKKTPLQTPPLYLQKKDTHFIPLHST